ncbi:MAG: serine/threonine protein kinase [Labilithrix sp.]|nr:serine/threonine protein kinase [Labilithrix sp.]
MNEASAALSKVCGACGARYPGDALFCPLDGMPLQSAASAGRDAEDDPYLGQEISGHIEIRQLVGIGAMGRVYRAFQRGIDRDVAVKILHRELSANAQLVSRFTREAKVASRLQHPNVVQVLLAGQLPDRALYMVMEYLEGLSLQSALAAAGGALPLPKALHVALQLCEASGEAHAVGIVHRDLKPENVMLVRRGTDPDFVKVLDFGIARINWGEQSVATAAGLIFGTARYISPEGAQGNAVGPASDVYSIATLLFQMLAGRTPFEGDQAVGLLVQQIHDTPPHLKSIPRAEYVPDPLADVIMANLVKDPKRREQDARALGHAIIDAAKQSGLAAEDISRPMLRRAPSAMQLPPTERTKQHDLSPELAERMSPPPTRVMEPRSNGTHASGGERPLMAATAKWEPPTEFQARLAEAVGASRERPSGVVPASPSSRPVPAAAHSRPRSPSGVDETMDDASFEPPVAAAPATIVTPPPSFPAGGRGGTRPGASAPRTMPGDAYEGDDEEDDDDGRKPSTQYAAPVPDPTGPPARARATAARAPASRRDVARESSRPHPSSAPPPSSRGDTSARRATTIEHGDEPRRSRGLLFVILCFVLGAAIAAGWAWRMGKLGGTDGDDERYVARATDAMYKHRFVAPAGDNVRDITDEGLKKWPNDHRLLDIRMRAANELVSQATAQRSAGDIMEALRLARAAHDLDSNDPSAKRLVDQYEAELAAFTTPTAPPLVKPPGTVPVVNGKPGVPPSAAPPAPPASAAATAFKVILDANVAAPRVGQTVEFTARVAPTKGTFEGAVFVISGPGLGGGASMPAQSPSPGVFKASFAFLEGGRFDVTFTTQADGKPLKAARSLTAGDGGAVVPPKLPDPGPKPPVPAPTGSVKWM